MPWASALKLSLLVDRVMHSEQGTIPSVQLRESPKELREIHRHWQSSEPQLHTLGTPFPLPPNGVSVWAQLTAFVHLVYGAQIFRGVTLTCHQLGMLQTGSLPEV